MNNNRQYVQVLGQKNKLTFFCVLVLSMAFIVIILAKLFPPEHTRVDGSSPARSPDLTVSGKLACAPKKLDEILFIRAGQARDEDGMSGLVGRGKVDILQPGSSAHIISTDEDGFSDISVRSGYSIGVDCWIPTQVLGR